MTSGPWMGVALLTVLLVGTTPPGAPGAWAHEHEPPNAGWYQAGGGPGRTQVAALPAILDIVAYAELLEPPEGLPADRPFHMVAGTGALFTMTFEWIVDGEDGFPPRHGTCSFVRAWLPAAEAIERTEPVPCQEGSAVAGYDPVQDTFLGCRAPVPGGPQGMLIALDRATLTTRWEVDLQALAGLQAGETISCRGAAIDPADRLVVLVSYTDASGATVTSVDLDDGGVRWSTSLDALKASSLGGLFPATGQGSRFSPADVILTPSGIAVPGETAGRAIVFLDRQGTVLSAFEAPTNNLFVGGYTDGGALPVDPLGSYTATAVGDEVAMVLGAYLSVFDAGSGERLRRAKVDNLLHHAGEPGWWLDTVLVNGNRGLTAYDASDLSTRWRSSDANGLGPLLIAPPDRVLALTESSSDGVTVVNLAILDLATGRLVWRTDLPFEGSSALGDAGMYPLPSGDGLLVWWPGGSFYRLGEAPAAWVPGFEASGAYPRPGEAVEVTPTAAPRGEPARYRLAWGDGTLNGGPPGTTFTHAFAEPGLYTVQVTAIYDDGTTGTGTTTIDVGGEPPAQLNPLQQAFASENQDLTFGILGVALAVGGGLIAVGRQRRRRRRVHRELAAVETAYSTTRDRPLECEAALAERKAHVRGLGLDGKLDQSEVLLLERRIDELGQQLRMEAIDERFAFLSVGMARTLREMLADGRISSWERQHFLDALERDEHLTKAQKRRLRQQIEAWFQRDEGEAA